MIVFSKKFAALLCVVAMLVSALSSCGMPLDEALDNAKESKGDTSSVGEVQDGSNEESSAESSEESEGSYDLSTDLERFYELYELLSEHYMGDMDPEEMMLNALYVYVESLGDPYTQYMTADYSNSFIDGNYGKKVGIGVRIYMTEDAEGIIVYYVFEDAPAHKAGILKGDIITAVDGVPVTFETYNESVNRVSGEEGTTVTLTVLRNGKTMTIPVVRGSFVVSSVEYRTLESNPEIGYVRIDGLATDTDKAFKEAVLALKDLGVKKYIFDVREDSGGYLSTIISLLDMLLPEGPIVRRNFADGREIVDSSDADRIINAPMAVLINGNTASAAELFAAALKDYKLATLVGETTFGKGVVQTLFPLKNGDTVKITTSTYSPPYSDNFNGVGVSPDVEVSLPEGKLYYMVSEEEDTQLHAAIKALEELGAQD